MRVLVDDLNDAARVVTARVEQPNWQLDELAQAVADFLLTSTISSSDGRPLFEWPPSAVLGYGVMIGVLAGYNVAEREQSR